MRYRFPVIEGCPSHEAGSTYFNPGGGTIQFLFQKKSGIQSFRFAATIAGVAFNAFVLVYGSYAVLEPYHTHRAERNAVAAADTFILVDFHFFSSTSRSQIAPHFLLARSKAPSANSISVVSCSAVGTTLSLEPPSGTDGGLIA